jgi:hypothetical protein
MRSKQILCLSDGSVSSKNSFDIALNEFLMPHDKVKVLSVCDFYKKDLPENFHPKRIFTEYKKLLMKKVVNKKLLKN